MRRVLAIINLQLEVAYVSSEDRPIHGEIRNRVLFINAKSEKAALATFEHEIYEFKLKKIYTSLSEYG
jgi:hypothetical protein